MAGWQTLGDLKRSVQAFRPLLDRLDRVHAEHVQDGSPYAAESPASSDVAALPAPSEVDDLLSAAMVRLAAARNLTDAVFRQSESAYSGRSTSTYAHASLARSVIEASADANWLIEAGVKPAARVGRALTIAAYEIERQKAIGAADLDQALAEVRAAAAALDLPEKGEGFRRGFGSKAPTRDTLTKKLLGTDGIAYSALSAVAHGEAWALLFFGFDLADATAGGVVKMAPPVRRTSLSVLSTVRALARASWADSRYRGWDVAEVIAALEDSYGAAGIANDLRFWRDK
jgi:hypothetical protein